MAQNAQLITETMPVPGKQLIMNSSNASAKIAAIGTNDTLWYFYNKHHYRNNPAIGFSAFKSPYPSATNTLSIFASTFLSASTVTVNGAYVLLSRQATSTSTAVPVKIYLYNVSATNVPTTKVDSGLAVVTGTAGSFAGAMFTQPHAMTNYAIGFTNASLTTDTIKPYMNNASASTNTAVVPALRYGEGLSFIKFNGTWTPQLGFWGANTDKEYITIPMVSMNLAAGVLPATPPYCVNSPVSYSNTSTSLFTDPQYNLNQFFVTWPAAISPTAVPTVDPIYVANFGDGTGTVTPLPSSHTYTMAGTFTGTLTGNYQLSAVNGQKVTDAISGPASVGICTGINTLFASELLVYPNPSNGVITLNNMSYNSTIELVNILGESVYTEKVVTDSKSFDFSAIAKGNYYLKITSNEGKVTVKKLNFN